MTDSILGNTRTEVIVRVTDRETGEVLGERTRTVWLDNLDARTSADVVARTAAIAYQKASGRKVATRPQEGGR